jgi:hypothetical protein
VWLKRRAWSGCPVHPSAGPAIVLGRWSSRFLESRARIWPQALVQSPRAVPCEELCLDGLATLSRPAAHTGSELAVVLPVTLGSPSWKAWPARPRQARPRHSQSQPSLCALRPRAENDRSARLARETSASRGKWLSVRDRNWHKSADRSQMAHYGINRGNVAQPCNDHAHQAISQVSRCGTAGAESRGACVEQSSQLAAPDVGSSRSP